MCVRVRRVLAHGPNGTDTCLASLYGLAGDESNRACRAPATQELTKRESAGRAELHIIYCSTTRRFVVENAPRHTSPRGASRAAPVAAAMLASAGDDPGLALPRASSLGDAPREARRGDPPLDRAAYWLCFHLGVGILLPWNAYVTAVDYFAAIHPNAHVDRLFGVLYFLPNLSTLPFVLRFAHLAAPRLRVRFGFGVFLACLLVPAAAPRSLAALCAAVALTGVADAFAQGSLFGVVAQMPPAYTQALMGGKSFSGVVVSALRLVAKAASASDSVAGLRHGAVAYFAVAATWVASCLVAHGALERTEAYARSAAGEEGFRASDARRSTSRSGRRFETSTGSPSPPPRRRRTETRGTRRGRRVDPSSRGRGRRRLWGTPTASLATFGSSPRR